MTKPTDFDHMNLVTVHEILSAFSSGELSEEDVVRLLKLEPDEDLRSIMEDNRVPYPEVQK